MNSLATFMILLASTASVVAAVQEWRRTRTRPLCEQCSHAVAVHGPHGCRAVVEVMTYGAVRLCSCRRNRP